MMSANAAFARPPLVLLVDPVIASRHWMWRAMSQACGVLEAGSGEGARAWLDHRPDIDVLVVQDELPDQSGRDLVGDLASARHPIAERSIVLARPGPDWVRIAQAGVTLIERGDLRALLAKLASIAPRRHPWTAPLAPRRAPPARGCPGPARRWWR